MARKGAFPSVTLLNRVVGEQLGVEGDFHFKSTDAVRQRRDVKADFHRIAGAGSHIVERLALRSAPRGRRNVDLKVGRFEVDEEPGARACNCAVLGASYGDSGSTKCIG